MYLKPIVGPAPKLHIAVLIIEGEPRDINLAGGFKNSRRYLYAGSVFAHHYVDWVRPVESFVSTNSKVIFSRKQLAILSALDTLEPCE